MCGVLPSGQLVAQEWPMRIRLLVPKSKGWLGQVHKNGKAGIPRLSVSYQRKTRKFPDVRWTEIGTRQDNLAIAPQVNRQWTEL
jgi:hypothetical protein